MRGRRCRGGWCSWYCPTCSPQRLPGDRRFFGQFQNGNGSFMIHGLSATRPCHSSSSRGSQGRWKRCGNHRAVSMAHPRYGLDIGILVVFIVIVAAASHCDSRRWCTMTTRHHVDLARRSRLATATGRLDIVICSFGRTTEAARRRRHVVVSKCCGLTKLECARCAC